MTDPVVAPVAPEVVAPVAAEPVVAPAAAEVVAPPAAAEDSFDTMFAEAALAAEATPAPVAAPAVVAPPVAPAVVAPVVPPAPVAAPAVVAPPVAPAVVAPVVPPAPVAPVEAPEVKAQREAAELLLKPYEPTDDEKAALAKFKEEFPGEAVAVEAMMKSMDRTVNARVDAAVKAVLERVAPRLDAVESTVTTDAVEKHFTTLRAAHADYDAVVPKIPDWIKTQPTYLQPAMQAVYDGGSTEDVSALVAQFKQATGVVTSPKPPAAASPAVAAVPAPAAPSGAEDLTPVSARRVAAVPRGTPDPNDYEGAFAEAAAANL